MAEFFAKRTLQAIIALLLVSIIVFLGVFAIGSPADILVSPNASEAEIERADQGLRPRQAAVGAVLDFPAERPAG